MSAFDLYAACYDLLYRDKDYSAEADFVAALIGDVAPGAADLLELGCGTGGHAVALAARGWHVHGIDMSAEMVRRALDRRAAAGDAGRRLLFEQADLRNYRVGRSFDAVISLFHVMSYQTTNFDLLAAMTTARAHLRTGGPFVFDAWYGPAVLSDRPREAVKEASDEQVGVVRRTTPTVHVNANVVDVRFDIDIEDRTSGVRRHVTEDHRMRYLFLPEVEFLLQQSGFALAAAQRWLSDGAPDDRSWYACFVARAV